MAHVDPRPGSGQPVLSGSPRGVRLEVRKAAFPRVLARKGLAAVFDPEAQTRREALRSQRLNKAGQGMTGLDRSRLFRRR